MENLKKLSTRMWTALSITSLAVLISFVQYSSANSRVANGSEIPCNYSVLGDLCTAFNNAVQSGYERAQADAQKWQMLFIISLIAFAFTTYKARQQYQNVLADESPALPQ